MKTYAYRLLNVFAESTFGGNPLCVFEDARGLGDAEMHALTRQFNLSETTFILPSDVADARVRIFTPGHEMRFAGHPTLGTAQVVRDIAGCGDALTLELLAGVVPVSARGNTWTLTAPSQGVPATAAPVVPADEIAAWLGLVADDLPQPPLWVDTGAHHLLVPVRNADAVRRAKPDAMRLDRWQPSSGGRRVAYVFAFDGEADDGRISVLARYFFVKPDGGWTEDPATGSACANLGGWLIATGRMLPASLRVRQGEQAGRASVLWLDVSRDLAIRVGGQVVELGRGTVTL